MVPETPQTPSYVLFIDSNPDVRLALSDFLESVGYRIKLAATGREALQALEENLSLTAVIVDIALPDMEGMDLLKAIGRFNPHLPVIVLTGITELDREIRTFQHGAFAFLHKPYNREEVLALLGKAVNFHNMLETMTSIQEALQTSEERFQRVVTVSRDVIILADEQGRIIGWNEAAHTLFGYQAGEIMGHALITIIPDRYRAGHRQGMERYLHTGEVRALGKPLEMQGLRKDGSEIPIELSLSTWKQNGQVVFCGVIREISDRLKVEQTLQERERLSSLKYEISQILVEVQPLSRILQQCAEALVTHLDGAFARIWVMDHFSQRLHLQASAGLYTNLDGEHASIAIGQYKIGRIAQNRKPHLTNHVQEDPEIHNQEWAQREGMVAFAGYPLLVEEQVVGVLGMFARHRLTEATLRAMANIANGIGLCITQKQAEIHLRQLQDVRDMILESTQEGIYGLDLYGNTTFVNKAASQLLGWEAEELMGHSQHALIHHTKADGSPYLQEECPIYAAFHDGTVHSIFNEVFWRKDGTGFPVEYTSSPMKDQEGRLTGAVVVFRDVSERKRTEEMIRKGEQKFRAIYDQAPIGIAIINSVGGEFNDINQKYCDIVGYSKEEMLALRFQDITHPDDLQADLDNMSRLLVGDINIFRMEKRYFHKNGELRWVNLTCVPLWLESTDFRRHIAIVEDITERKRMEKEVRGAIDH